MPKKEKQVYPLDGISERDLETLHAAGLQNGFATRMNMDAVQKYCLLFNGDERVVAMVNAYTATNTLLVVLYRHGFLNMDAIRKTCGLKDHCATCGKELDGARYATSRKDNVTKLCPDCGTSEAMADFIEHNKNKLRPDTLADIKKMGRA